MGSVASATHSVRRLVQNAYRWVRGTGVAGTGATGMPDALPGRTDPAVDPHHRHLPDPAIPPWQSSETVTGGVECNICRWQGPGFVGPAHSERAQCPGCGSIARDRFLHWSFTQRVALNPALRIIEFSPRLGEAYRAAMATWFFYRTSDYDLGEHRGNIQLDLQAIELPDACLDVVLCAHVLEHVPDTDRALAELRRVTAPGGHLLLQVPVLQAATAPPAEPEFHGDNTPVFWRFGFDLTARLRGHGFQVDMLCTQELADAARSDQNPWTEWSGEFDVPGLLEGIIADNLVVIADGDIAARLGVTPGYMFITWDCRVA
jgi:SAM-dependent methyltransferase